MEAAIFIFIVALIQLVIKKQLSPRWRHAIWILIVIRLLMPVSLPSSLSLFNFSPIKHSAVFNYSPFKPASRGVTPHALEMAGRMEKEVVPPAGGLSSSPPSSRRFIWACFIIWLAGVVIFTSRIVQLDFAFAAKVGRTKMVTDSETLELLDQCRRRMGIRFPIGLLETDEVQTPALYGALHPRLLIPKGMSADLNPEELEHVFMHELAHIKRHDMVVHWIMTLAQILHWFNPLVWAALARMRVERELACDSLVLSYVKDAEKESYGSTLLKLLERFTQPSPNPGIVGIMERAEPIKERILSIAHYRKEAQWSFSALLLILLLGTIGLTDARTSLSDLPGLTHWWPADGTAEEKIGGHHAILHGNPGFAPGVYGQAFDLNGIDQFIEVPSSPDLCPKGSFSISTWVFPRQDKQQVIISKWGVWPAEYNNRSFVLHTLPELGLRFCTSDLKNQWNFHYQYFETKFEVLATNKWNHVVAVYDQASGRRQMYVNGMIVAERMDPPITLLETTVPLGIGAVIEDAKCTKTHSYFNGLIDDIRIYSRALSAEEIMRIYKMTGMKEP
ncbi:peptidase M56 BlaR1 [Pedosphaera parvula Ellin514]|uniref:Peptidase M56 BlaR1 n=2 Tax=Pedosphaera TaxID=1032526 RepID=B9XGU2_PEDPL|nr:peptidase M56 BlaR1 [Pedosphaera parvula Ellin514]